MELNYMMSYGAAETSVCLLRRYKLLKFFLPFHVRIFLILYMPCYITGVRLDSTLCLTWILLQEAYLDEQASETPVHNSMMLMVSFMSWKSKFLTMS